MKFEEYSIVEGTNSKNKFYDCKNGYIYSVPSYGLYQNKCHIKAECNCEKCIFFETKRNYITK